MVTNVNLRVTIHKLFLVILYGNVSVLGEQAHQGRCARPEGTGADCLSHTEWFTGAVTARDGRPVNLDVSGNGTRGFL